ncbi:MAG: hypothetical protein P1P86_11965 [Bacteroidales bacterium]|nr:hypothetical protein [Bacteroidales bacterium]
MNKKWMLAIGLIAALFIAACEQSGTSFDELDGNITMAEEEVADLKSAEALESDISSARFGGHMLEGGMMVGGSHLFFGNNFPPCATVTVDSDEFPKTITINYSEGCTGRMGLEKKGIVSIHMTDTILNEGAVYTVTFENLTMGQREISKTATYTNEGLNESDHWVISFESLSTTTFENQGELFTIVREFSGEREWLEGFETPEVSDDLLLLSRNGSITVNDELRFAKTTMEPLLIDRSCRWPLSGIAEITRDGETMTIDYGTGECDNIAQVSKDGVTEEIELNSGQFGKGFQRHNKHMKQNKGWW